MWNRGLSHAILPRVVCFVTSCLAHNVPCSYISDSGWASVPIRRCLFIDHILNGNNKNTIRYVVCYLHLNIYAAVGHTVLGCMSLVLVCGVVHSELSSFAIILLRKRELVAFVYICSCCLVGLCLFLEVQ